MGGLHGGLQGEPARHLFVVELCMSTGTGIPWDLNLGVKHNPGCRPRHAVITVSCAVGVTSNMGVLGVLSSIVCHDRRALWPCPHSLCIRLTTP